MPKLNQVVAAEKGKKAHLEDTLGQIASLVTTRPDAFMGLIRTYEPKEEGGDRLPGERKVVQSNVSDVVDQWVSAQVALADTTATKVWGNTGAKADIVVDGNVLVHGAPVEYMLFLESALKSALAFVSRLPTLDPAQRWSKDDTTGVYASEPVETVRNKKVPRTLTLAEATKEHPAQVNVWMEDVPEGTWKVVNHSGAVPMTQVREWTEKIHTLIEAVKYAREEANSIDVDNQDVGRAVFDFVFG